eukprot:1059182-Prorocentrum_lima.AAC.1
MLRGLVGPILVAFLEGHRALLDPGCSVEGTMIPALPSLQPGAALRRSRTSWSESKSCEGRDPL